MLKKLLCILLAGVMTLSLASCGKEIEDNPVNTPDNPVQSDAPVTGDSSDNGDTPDTPPVEVPEEEWKYDFPNDFIEINGLSYIWAQLDEETRIALGEVMNAIANVDIYCSLSQGISLEDKQHFLELITHCTTGYTYDVSKYTIHKNDETGRIVGITLSYNLDYNSLDYIEDAHNRTKQVRARVDEIVSGMPNGSDYEKVKYLYETLIFSCTYSENSISPFTAYGALVDGHATCQGYADAMHLLLAAAGFETCFCLGIGDAESVTHKWNYVKLSDGEWYIVDATWGDPEGKDEDYIKYDYLLISDEELLKTHKEKFEAHYYEVPDANGTEFNYFAMEGYLAETYEQAKEILTQQAIECGKSGRRYIQVQFTNLDAFNEAKDKFFSGDYEMQDVIKAANKESGSDFMTNSWTKLVREENLTMILTLKYE